MNNRAATAARTLCAWLREPAAGLPSGVSWEQVCACARRHHLEPYLYYQLKNQGAADAVPGPIPR